MEQRSYMPAVPEVSALEVERLKENIRLVESFIMEALEPDVDFGTLPGTEAPSLWEPGASKLMNLFNAYDTPEVVKLDLGPPLLVVVKAQLKHRGDDTVLAEGLGAAATTETKYRYHWVEDPEAYGYQKESLPTRTRGKKTLYRIPNPEWEGLLNTLIKMARKRAKVDAAQDLPGVASALRKKFQEYLGREGEELSEEPDWNRFWTRARALGFDRASVHATLSVSSMKEWLSQGKTLKDALEILSQKARLL